MKKCVTQPIRQLVTSMEQFKCYLDLDDCLTDFDLAVKKLGPEAEKGLGDNAGDANNKVMWDAILQAREFFWSEMKWISKGKELWDIVEKYHPVILSSPGDNPYAKAGKETWVRNNIPGTPLIVEKDKYLFAERDAVLIDDSKPNITRWAESGGTGILYEGDPEFVRKELIQIKDSL